jgi:hypothetical protein
MLFAVAENGPPYFEQLAAPSFHAGQSESRDLRFARAIRLRRAAIHEEIADCLRGQEEIYNLASALADQIDNLANVDKTLRNALTQIELRLQRSGAFYVSQEQADIIRAGIAEVGADTPRFCVESIPKIPVHMFDEALAALETKRQRAA